MSGSGENVRDLHRQAMDLVEGLDIDRHRGDIDDEAYAQGLLEASQLETRAAVLLIARHGAPSPTTGIILRSAATLAYQGGREEKAKRMARYGLRRIDEEGTRLELQALLDEIEG